MKLLSLNKNLFYTHINTFHTSSLIFKEVNVLIISFFDAVIHLRIIEANISKSSAIFALTMHPRIS